MSYSHPYQDAEFVLRHIVDLDGLCEKAGLSEVNMDLALAILDEAGKMGAEVLAPLNRVGDAQGAKLGPNGVEETPGFKDAYLQFAESGWLSLTVAEEFGGQNLPNVLSTTYNIYCVFLFEKRYWNIFLAYKKSAYILVGRR